MSGGYRYICLTCQPTNEGMIDICERCIDFLKGKRGDIDESFLNNILEEFQKFNHDIGTHIFLRVCFGENYDVY